MLHILAASAALVVSTTRDETTTRWHDLRPILSASVGTQPGIDLRLHLTSSRIDDLEPDHHDLPIGADAALDEDGCVQAIVNAIRAEEAAELQGVTSRGGGVEIVGNDAAQRVAREAVEALRAAALDSVVVEVYRLRDADLANEPLSVIDRGRTAALLDRIDPRAAYRQSVRIGRSAGLGDQEVTNFLHDHDVEVAQGAVGVDPVVSSLRTGFEVGLRVERASDGSGFLVRTWGRDGRVDPEMRTIELASLGSAPLDLPQVATSLWTSSALLEQGGAMLIDHDGGGAEALLLRIAPGAPSPTPRSVLPLGELGIRPMVPAIPRVGTASPSGGWPRGRDEFMDGAGSRRSFQPNLAAAMDEIQAGRAVRFGSSVVFARPSAITDELRAAVEDRRASLPVRTVAVEVRYGTLPSKDATTALGADDLASLAATLSGRLLGSGLENDGVLLVGGTEFAYLKDHDVRIAAGSVIADPVVDAAFEGIAVWCMPMVGPEGGVLSAWLDVQVHAPTAGTRDVTTSSYRAAPGDGSKDAPAMTGAFERDLAIELPVTRRAASRTLVETESGAWTVVSTRPLSGSDETLVVLTRITSL
ncbi:MAG: hypothetical protein AAGB93_05810 [Planctomycetota bacterium]